MEFRVDCSCGNYVLVSEGAAGSTRDCSCGRIVPIPSLKELRLQAGLPPYELSPGMVIEYLLAQRTLPPNKECVQCRIETNEIVQVEIECEKTWVHGRGILFWIALVLLAPFNAFGVWVLERGNEEVYGENKRYTVPIAICAKCRKSLCNRTRVNQALQSIPEYGRLLDKYPDATVTLV